MKLSNAKPQPESRADHNLSFMDRSALKAFMDPRAAIVTPPGKGWRGWPEAYGYLTSQPKIQRLQISDIVAEALEQILYPGETYRTTSIHQFSPR